MKCIASAARGLLAAMLAGIATLLPLGAAASFTATFDAGLACAFPLQVDGTDDRSHARAMKNGGTLAAGTRSGLTFTNLDTGDSPSLRSSGFTQTTRADPDGTQTVDICAALS